MNNTDLRPATYNPRKITDGRLKELKSSLERLGDLGGVVNNVRTGNLITGHQRLKVFPLDAVIHKVPFHDDIGTVAMGHIEFDGKRYSYREVDWDLDKEKMANYVANREYGTFDMERLEVQFEEMVGLDGFEELGLSEDMEELGFDMDGGRKFHSDDDHVPEEESPLFQIKLGDLVEIGNHRLLCGDSTKRPDVARLMDSDKAVLLHADPPYGMGKEKDGIANDNLYGEKLDQFQMRWWKSFRLFIEDNASGYIWGTAENLWRLWYKGGLKDSETITFRNEIVWDKSSCHGMGSEQHRMFPTASERCLFFMIGEQGFNNNGDNYWEEWEPIRKYLYEEMDKLKNDLGLSLDDIGTKLGVSGRMLGHWTLKSQWEFIGEKHYSQLRRLGENQSFKKDYETLKKDYETLKKDYETLKKDFYSTRSPFNSAHDNMTDVWKFDRVQGEERHGHATPKPVQVIERIIKSSSLEKSIVTDPFLGSGTTLIASEKTGRTCYGMEIDPGYCSVIVQRYCEFTNDWNVLINGKKTLTKEKK